MENKNIIIILVAVVIVLAVIAGAMFMQQSHAKEPTKLKITSDKKQTEGGKLKIQLTDTNKTALSKEIVNITVTDKKGKTVVDDVVGQIHCKCHIWRKRKPHRKHHSTEADYQGKGQKDNKQEKQR